MRFARHVQPVTVQQRCRADIEPKRSPVVWIARLAMALEVVCDVLIVNRCPDRRSTFTDGLWQFRSTQISHSSSKARGLRQL
jgi:hypothetical protein